MSGQDRPRVAVSVSNPDETELIARRLSSLHLSLLFTEIVRHLLAAGYDVAYGGVLDAPPGPGQTNFTRTMLDLATAYRADLRPEPDRLWSYSAPPNRRNPDAWNALVTTYARQFRFVLGDGTPEGGVPPGVNSGAALDALAFTAMRQQMANECAARVIVAGRLVGYSGRYPGVIEEALTSAAATRPLYVVGGYGGCAAALARHLEGGQVEELSQRWQTARTPAVAGLAEQLNGTRYRIDLDADLARLLPQGRWDLTHDGLTAAEHQRLGQATDPDEVAALVLRGLRSLS